MPQYNANYVYSPRYGTRYMGPMANIAQNASGQSVSDPLAPQGQQQTSGNNPYSTPGYTQQNPQMGSAGMQVPDAMADYPEMNVTQVDSGAIGYTNTSGRDMSAVENLSDFGFRQKQVSNNLPTYQPPIQGTANTSWDPIVAPPPVEPPPVVVDSGSGDGSVGVPGSGSSVDDILRDEFNINPDDYSTITEPDENGWVVLEKDDPTLSGIQINVEDGKFDPGQYNIAGTTENNNEGRWYGNQAGWTPNQWVEMGLDLKKYPWWMPGGLLAYLASDALIGYDTVNIGGEQVITTRGSFDEGAFSETGGQDVSGGATGSNVAVDANGNKISIGYGYGQVDPAIAAALGYTVVGGGETKDTDYVGSKVDSDYAYAADSLDGAYSSLVDHYLSDPKTVTDSLDAMGIAQLSEITKDRTPTEAELQRLIDDTARRATNSSTDSGAGSSGSYANDTSSLSAGRGSGPGTNPSSSISGGSGRTDGGYGW